MQRAITDASGDVRVDAVDVEQVLDDQLPVEPDPVVQRSVADQIRSLSAE